MQVPEIRLNMTERDLDNVNVINRLPAVKNRTHAVAVALAFTRFILDHLLDHPGSELLIRDGEIFTRIVAPDFRR